MRNKIFWVTVLCSILSIANPVLAKTKPILPVHQKLSSNRSVQPKIEAKPVLPVYLELSSGSTTQSGRETGSDPDLKAAKAKHNSTGVFSAALGYAFSNHLRLDVNLTHIPEWRTSARSTTIEGDAAYSHAHISSLATTLNGYYDFACFSAGGILPYVTAGAGVSRNKISDVDNFIDNEFSSRRYGRSQSNLTWKIGAGVNYHINERMYLGLGYRFADLGKADTKAGYKTDFQHDITIFTLSPYKTSFKRLYSHQALIAVGIKL